MDPTARRTPLPTDLSGTGRFTVATFGSGDQMLLLGALSALLEYLPSAAVRLVVFNLDYQKEMFRRDNFRPQSLNEVAHSFEQPELGGVDYHVLQNRTGHVDLLARLINQEFRQEARSDIVVFLGPRERFHDKFPDGMLDTRRGSKPRFFFLAYQLPGAAAGASYSGLNDAGVGGSDISDSVQTIARSGGLIMSGPPGGVPDTLSRAIGKLHGKTLSVESPRQFAKAIKEIKRQSGR